MSDIRERIEDDRGLLKKIQMFVPGFRGYRIKEDLRDADKMLRGQLSNKISLLRNDLENTRRMIPVRFDSKEPEYIGGIINQYKKLESLVLHSASGYSGISADIAFKQDELDRLYEYDLKMFEDLQDIENTNNLLKTAVSSGNADSTVNQIINLRSLLDKFEVDFNNRINIVQDTLVSA